jgi:hypothetical protein
MTPEEAKEYGIIDEVIRECFSPHDIRSKSMTNQQQYNYSKSSAVSQRILSTGTQHTATNFSQLPATLCLPFHSREREASGKR